MNAAEHVGQTYARWTVLAAPTRLKLGRYPQALCRCECGTEKEIDLLSVVKGASRSCGCYMREKARTHFLSLTTEYRVWASMIQRCENPKTRGYARYGGRGIRVCELWRTDFTAFLAHVGKRPSPRHSIDRIDVNGNYEPGNVRWATTGEQARNKRSNRILTVDGISLCLTDWAARSGIPPKALDSRLRRGWNPRLSVTARVGARPTAEQRKGD